jgi:hypothetical protein
VLDETEAGKVCAKPGAQPRAAAATVMTPKKRIGGLQPDTL